MKEKKDLGGHIFELIPFTMFLGVVALFYWLWTTFAR